jgi:hypothetical protein
MNAALWVLAACALFACELASRYLDHGWPHFLQMFRGARRSFPARLVMLGAWLWLGWHVFAR